MGDPNSYKAWTFPLRLHLPSVRSVRRWTRFIAHFRQYNRANVRQSLRARWSDRYPCLDDWSGEAGGGGRQYLLQDLWAAKKIFKHNPQYHFDIGSRIDGFISHLLVFREVTVVDIRPLLHNIEGLRFVKSDATTLTAFASNSVESLSTLHAAEHFGLGRYGDAVDPEACYTFMHSLVRVLAPGGRLYFAVPVGRERVQFNAHRIFSPDTIIAEFGALELLSFSAIMDDGAFLENVPPSAARDANYACGLFEFTKA